MRRQHAGESYGGPGHGQSHIEEENNHQENLLADKVKSLKSLTIDIGDEVRYQNNMVKQMDDDFEKGGNILRSTMNRLGLIAKTGGWKHIFYLLGFCFFVFFMLWLILKFR